MVPFEQLIVVDVFMLVSSYILVYVSAMILRKRIPIEEYKFKVPGGYGFLKFICIMPMCVAVFSFFINGTDYFLGGMAGIISGPIFYAIFKRVCGGLAVKDPVAHPINPKTHLAVGDMKRVSFLFFVLGLIGAAGCFFLPWYEADWVFPDDYDMTLWGSQGAMWMAIRVLTIICLVLAIVFYMIWRKIDYTEKGKAVA
jgi:amino acid transporter